MVFPLQIAPPFATPQENAYASKFGDYSRHTIDSDYFDKDSSKKNAVFSPACYMHCTILSIQFQTITPSNSNVSLSSFLGSWFYNGFNGGDGNIVIDDCDKINCSKNCPVA